MDSKNNQKLKKPLSDETLEQTLYDEPEIYREIMDNCILAMVGLDLQQRYEAIDRLKDYLPERQQVYVASRLVDKNRREIVWTCENAVCWQIVTKIPTHLRTIRLFEEIHYILMQ